MIVFCVFQPVIDDEESISEHAKVSELHKDPGINHPQSVSEVGWHFWASPRRTSECVCKQLGVQS